VLITASYPFLSKGKFGRVRTTAGTHGGIPVIHPIFHKVSFVDIFAIFTINFYNTKQSQAAELKAERETTKLAQALATQS